MWELPIDGPVIDTERGALDIIGDSYHDDVVVIPVERLAPEFFDLGTGLAGAVLQKFVQYGKQVVILGDISPYVAESSALRDFVYESNHGRHVWFLTDRDALTERLG